MAQTLPTYRRQVIASGIQGGGDARSAVSPTSPLAQGLANVAQGGATLARAISAEEYDARQRVEDQAAITVANTLSEGQVYWQQNFNERTQEWSPGQKDLREGINSDFDKWADDTESKLPTDASRKYFRQHAIGMKTKMLTGAYSYQEKATTDALNAQTAAGIQADENVVYGDASQFDQVYTRRMEPMLARKDLDDATKITRATEYRRKLALAAERGELERDPAAWLVKRFGEPGAQTAAAGGTTSIKAAIFGQESGSGTADTSRFNSQGVIGPMQVQKATFEGLQRNGDIPKDWDITNPVHNKAAGDKLIDILSAKYNGDPAKVAAAYYGGEKAVAADGTIKRDMRNLTRPGDPTVGEYVDQVLGRMKKGGDGGVLLASAGGDVGPLTMGKASLPDGWSKTGGTPAVVEGMAKAGNLDLTTRPRVRNDDGSVSTVRTISVTFDEGTFLLPTVIGKKVVSDEEAIEHFKKTGENFGLFKTPEAADKYGVALHNQQESMYVGTERGAPGQPVSSAPKTYSALDWEQQSALRTMAETKIRQGDARYKAGVTAQMRDAQAMHRDGIVDPVPMTEQQFTRAFGEEGPRLYAEYQNSRLMGADIGSFKSMPVGDIAAVLERGRPQPGEGYAAADQRQNLRLQAAQQIQQQRKADPMGYVVANTPELKGMQARIDAAQPADRPALTQRFVTDSLAEQARLGITQPRVLTPGQADSISQQAMSATRPEDSANLIGGLEAQYGQHFPRVFNELVAGKKIANELLIIPNLQTPAAREGVSRLARVKEADLTQGIDAKDQKTVKDLVTTNLEAMGATVPLLTEQSSEVMNAYETTMRKMAYSFMAGGQSPSDAVTRAQSLLLGQYQFAGSMRLPKAVDQSAAKQGAQSRLYDSLDGVDVPRDLVAGARQPEEVQQEWLRTVRARPLWFTNDDDSGVSLWAQGADGVRYRVTKGGAPVSFTWAELQLPTRTPTGAPQDMGRPAIGTGAGLRRQARQQ